MTFGQKMQSLGASWMLLDFSHASMTTRPARCMRSMFATLTVRNNNINRLIIHDLANRAVCHIVIIVSFPCGQIVITLQYEQHNHGTQNNSDR